MIPNSTREGTDKVTAIVTSGAAAAAAVSNPSSGVLLAMFPAIIGFVLFAGFELYTARAHSWWDRLWKSKWTRPEELRDIIEANKDKRWVLETITESVKRLLDSVDDAAAVPLGVLAAEYLGAQQRPDAFFRGFSRVVADLSADEINDLKAVLDVLREPLQRDEVYLGIVKSRSDLLVDTVFEQRADGVVAVLADDREPLARGAAPSSFLRLANLLKVHGLAQEAGSNVLNAQSGPGVMVIQTKTFRRIANLLSV